MLVINPRDDEAFVGVCHGLIGDNATPAAFEAALHPQYPDAVVRARDLSSEQANVWYVYRDGHWIRPGPRADRGVHR